MRPTNRTVRILSLLLGLAFTLGCSGKGDQGPTEPKSATKSTSPVAAVMPPASTSPTMLLSLSDKDIIRPGKDTEIVSVSPKAVVIKATGSTPAFELPAIARYPESGVKVRLGIEVPDNTLVQLFYRSENSQVYNADRSIKRNIRKGYNEITFDLSNTPLVGRLRIDPGRVKGEYKISLLEVTPVQ